VQITAVKNYEKNTFGELIEAVYGVDVYVYIFCKI